MVVAVGFACQFEIARRHVQRVSEIVREQAGEGFQSLVLALPVRQFVALRLQRGAVLALSRVVAPDYEPTKRVRRGPVRDEKSSVDQRDTVCRLIRDDWIAEQYATDQSDPRPRGDAERRGAIAVAGL
ncbi:hypothetical protein ACOZ4I_17420 (plasmid) [Haloarcula salina]|uniref:hypothetical protein n=1 Tax=Haloarcula salina TaxID=1429914 RepID=UPI003C7030DE